MIHGQGLEEKPTNPKPCRLTKEGVTPDTLLRNTEKICQKPELEFLQAGAIVPD
jgi:hypothetical protein